MNKDTKLGICGALFVISLIAFIVIAITCTVKSIKFDQNCGGYLKQTADANTPEIALERISLAIDYIEAKRLKFGYTSVLYKTEDENVEFWYKNIKACQKELENCLDGTQLEKSNVLMKVRESLTDDYNGRTTLTLPTGISRHPYNKAWAWACWSAVIVLIVSGAVLVIESDF